MSSVFTDNEWSPLKCVLVGRANNSCFPSAPARMTEATLPERHWPNFRANNPFPKEILQEAEVELDQFSAILQREGIEVHRADVVDWLSHGGYTGAMPRDGLLVVGNHVIESIFSWPCRRNEVDLAYGGILSQLEQDTSVKVIKAPKPTGRETLLDDNPLGPWAINNSRAVFDAADFMRLGRTILGQLSHVTNMKGFEYVQATVPEGYVVELVDVDDEHAMHIDATILPLRPGLLVYNPQRVTEVSLRKHQVLKDWELCPLPFVPMPREYPPSFMVSPWITLNVLVLDGRKVVVEESDEDFAEWLRELGMEPIPCPFKHVHSIGGSFHCATVDLKRD